MPLPLVSVVIPAHNGEEFIADSIQSVLDQTYPRVECIVVDDGSTDGTEERVASFGERVRYVKQSRQGVAAARNQGASQARGDFIAFVDADDLWLPRKLEHQMELFERDPRLDLVYCGIHLVDSNLRFFGRIDPPTEDVALHNTLLLERPVMTIALTGVIRKHVFDEVGGFDPKLSTSADCDLACRVACSYRIGVVNRPLALYRFHSTQMHRDPKRIESDMKKVFEKLFSNGELPPDLASKRRRALANLNISLAGVYLIMGRRWRGFSHVGRALLLRPDRVLDAIKRMTIPGSGIKRST